MNRLSDALTGILLRLSMLTQLFRTILELPLLQTIFRFIFSNLDSLVDALDQKLLARSPKPWLFSNVWDSPFLSDGWKPVNEEVFKADLTVKKGALPAALNGEFVRNGPNPQFKPRGQYHLFDGDGMLHGIRIQDGKASYVNRWVRTKRLEHERKLGRAEFIKIGDLQGVVGVIRVLLQKVKQVLCMHPQSDLDGMLGTGNTALEYHSGSLLALHEGDLPYAVRVLADGQLETLGTVSYGGKWKYPFTAHPKVDPVTKEMIFFGYNVNSKPYCRYGVVSKEGELIRNIPVPLDNPIMMHDFAITENYSIIMDLPFIFDPKIMVKKGQIPFVFDPSKRSRFGILPRHATSPAEIKWFVSPACFVFHTANAWEEKETNEVVLYACRFETMDLSFAAKNMDQSFYCWRFNMLDGTVTEGAIETNPADFPRVHPSLLGRKARFAYCAHLGGYLPPKFDGIEKYDMDAGKRINSLRYPANTYGGEAVFVPNVPSSAPKPKAKSKSDAQGEDDGYLLTFLHDEKTNKSSFAVFNAKTMSADPVAIVELPTRVPYGFHGIFVPEVELRNQQNPPF